MGKERLFTKMGIHMKERLKLGYSREEVNSDGKMGLFTKADLIRIKSAEKDVTIGMTEAAMKVTC